MANRISIAACNARRHRRFDLSAIFPLVDDGARPTFRSTTGCGDNARFRANRQERRIGFKSFRAKRRQNDVDNPVVVFRIFSKTESNSPAL